VVDTPDWEVGIVLEEDILAVGEDIPAVGEDIPAVEEDIPAVGEDIPVVEVDSPGQEVLESHQAPDHNKEVQTSYLLNL